MRVLNQKNFSQFFLGLCCLLSSSFLFAETEYLRWGGDPSGSAPYIIIDPNNPETLVGFEVELAEALARELGKKAKFVQSPWDSLIPNLKMKSFDIVLNGMEITEDRKKEVNFSTPYFHTHLKLSVRAKEQKILGLDDLAGKRVGATKDTFAERFLRKQGNIDVASYDDQSPLYEDLAIGDDRLHAVLMDHPAALYGANIDPRLKTLDQDIENVAYGICVRKEDTELLKEINQALKKLISTGELRRIYERWGVWNRTMTELFPDPSPIHEEATEFESFRKTFQKKEDFVTRLGSYTNYIPMLLKGAYMTLKISSLSMICAMILGLLIALIRLYAHWALAAGAAACVELIRGTPLLIQLFLIYYGLPNLGIRLDPFTAAILGLALNYSAYESEIYRASIMAIPHSQMETALALGLNRWQALVHVILPQSVRSIMPPMTNDFISLLKDSSLVSVITLVELTRVYGQLSAASYDYLGIGVLTAILYFLMGMPFVRLSRYIEKRFSYDRHSLHNLY